MTSDTEVSGDRDGIDRASETVNRLASGLPRVMAALQQLVRELRVSDDEWRRVIGFVSDVAAAGELGALSDVLGLSVIVDDNRPHRAGATQSDPEGPFHRPGAPLEDSPARICRDDEPGDRLIVSGRVRSTSGGPLPGSVVDVWHAAANGRYEHQDPDQPEWNLRRRVRADATGRYEFETVVPAAYHIGAADGPVGTLLRCAGRTPVRPAHLHYIVTADDHEPLTTQVFIAGDPWLDADIIGAVKEPLIADVMKTDGKRRLTFDVTLARLG